jgi:hypothetical protein
MPRSITAQDILEDIEFEIAQGIISEELGEGLEVIKSHQNKVRKQTFKNLKATDPYREIISRQFQTTDMLIALLQEMALNLQAMKLEIKRLRQSPSSEQPDGIGSAPQVERKYTYKARSAGNYLANTLELPPTDEITDAMKPEAIHVDLQARPIQWPVVGWLLTKLKIFYQRPAFFYTQLLVNRQAEVNRTLGDRILQIESLLSLQQTQIEALKEQIDSLQPENPSDPHSNLETP